MGNCYRFIGYDEQKQYGKQDIIKMYLAEGRSQEESERLAGPVTRFLWSSQKAEQRLWQEVRQHETTGLDLDRSIKPKKEKVRFNEEKQAESDVERKAQ